MASTNFINECKNFADSNRLGKVTVDSTTLDETNYLSEMSINDSCLTNDVINGSVVDKTISISTINYTEDILNKEVNAQVGVKFSDDTTEYVNEGNFTITEEEIDDTGTTATYEGSNSLSSLDKVYECGIAESSLATATIGDFYADACSQAGLTPNETTFTNSTIVVGGNPFNNGETIRTVLSQVASAGLYFIEIDENTSKICLKWLDTALTETFTKDDYSELTKGTVYGPIDCLVIQDTYTDGENVTRGTGDKVFTINDNYFLYTEELRTQAIDAIWAKVEGLTYTTYEMSTYTGRPYLKKGNKIRITEQDDTTFDTYVLDHTFTYDGSFSSTLKATALADEQVAIKNTITSASNKFRNVQRMVDKINGVIEDKIEGMEEKIDEGLKTSQIHYLATSESSGVTTETSGWTTTIQSMTATNKYLWTYYTYTTQGGDTSDTTPCITGVYGDTGSTGTGISSITYYYARTTTQTAPAEADVTETTMPTIDSTNKYLWQKEVIAYTNSTSKTSVVLLAVYGDTGAKGDDGDDGTSVTVSSTSVTYATSTSGTTAPTSGWQSTIPSVAKGSYLWTKTIVNYSPSGSTTTYTSSYQGTNGEDGSKGDTGVGVAGITYQYYLSTSNTTQTGGSWSTTIPAYVSGRYYWIKPIVTYTDSSTKEGTPALDNGLTSANSTAAAANSTANTASGNATTALNTVNNLSIGGRNLVLNSNFSNGTTNWSNWGSPTTREIVTVDNKNWLHCVCTSTSYQGLSQNRYTVTSLNDTEPSTQYTLSFTMYAAEANSGSTCGIHWINSSGSIVSQSWCTTALTTTAQRFSYTFTSGANTCRFNIMVGKGGNSTTLEYWITDIKLEKGNKATDWTPAPEDVQSQIDDNAEDIGTLQSNQESFVTTETYNSDWTLKKNEILGTVEDNYVAESEYNSYKETTATAISQKADSATIKATATTVVNDAISGIQSTIDNVEETFTFNTNGLTIARGSSTMSLVLQNDRLSFQNSGSEVAYMSSNSFELSALKTFKIGNFGFVVRDNNNVSFKKI